MIGQGDRAEIRVLDRPAFTGDRRDCHVQRGRVALPGNDNRSHVGLRAGEVLDGARHGARRTGGTELESLHEPRTREPRTLEPGTENPRTRNREPRTPEPERRTPPPVLMLNW